MSFVSEFLRESEMEKFEILDETVLKTKLDFHQKQTSRDCYGSGIVISFLKLKI